MPPTGEHDTAASRRESLEAAFNSFEENAPPEPEVEEEDSTPTPQEAMDGEPGDQGDETEVPNEEELEASDTGESDEESEDEEQQEETTTLKAPASWGPKAKEDWGKVPAHLQQEITKRERDYSMGIQKNAESAKLGQSIKEVLAPYAHFMAAEGADEVQAVQNLARHAGIMRSGTQFQKAQTVAQIISQYGVDIGMLDSMLAGEQVDESTHQISQLLDQRLAPLEQMLQQGQQNVAQTIQDTNAREIETFAANPKNEFFEDVRDTMADIIEIRASKGQECTLDEAYKIAVSMNPEIQSVLAERGKRNAITNNHANLQKKQQAASSVKSSSTPPNTQEPAPLNLRDQIAAAWDDTAGDEGGRI